MAFPEPIPFTEPILDGESLIPLAIKSPNYTPEGSQGWRIGRDGKAEFRDLTARGDLVLDNDRVPPNFSLSRYLEMKYYWRSVNKFLAHDTGDLTVTTTAPVFVTGFDMLSDGENTFNINSRAFFNMPLKPDENLLINFVVNLDVSVAVAGSTFVGELMYKDPAVSTYTILPQQVILNGPVGFRMPITKAWRIKFYDGGPWDIRFRCRLSGGAGTYTVRSQHSTISVDVMSSSIVGG